MSDSKTIKNSEIYGGKGSIYCDLIWIECGFHMDLILILCGFNVDFMIVLKQNIDGFFWAHHGGMKQKYGPIFLLHAPPSGVGS